jgi:hypothetical protein
MTKTHSILESLDKVKHEVELRNPIQARVYLIQACELIEAASTDAYDDAIVTLDAACTALEFQLFGTEQQKVEFTQMLTHANQ